MGQDPDTSGSCSIRWATRRKFSDRIAAAAQLADRSGRSLGCRSATRSWQAAAGRQNERRVKLVLDALARLGHLSSTDGGARFTIRRGQ